MAIEKGFIKCPERHCSEIAEVMQAGGKRSTLYTKCPACGTNQGNGVARQKHLSENLKASIEELDIKVIEAAIDKRAASADTQEKASRGEIMDVIKSSDLHIMEKVRKKAAIPSKNQAYSVSDDTASIPSEKPKEIPKGSPSAPPVLLGVLALFAALLAAIFATRKPTNKPKGQTA
jgi:predicted  nucleic acid-binding Zn-ribbon protein